ncbi:acyltransferase [Cellvibrio sp. KY-GH-1]|uniref:acyltransferase family protein n=1 Tax=Cellvibrio sp. KY-GH-1 TaxID=2303332 RepID=UPI0012488421|nr:acyltransferase [Cellvibrio sp. KY-GH-1]QEY16078.1 acyltransferase [Cellvibrio sp. KY-GH-1]
MRNIQIDILRALGLAMIILAHISPPAVIQQMRNFDVPLMVLISGMAFGLSFKQEAYNHYLWKRIKRLVFPVWIFLTGYFATLALLDLDIETLSARKIIRSYLLIDGIGYVWIIKVFLLVALVSPLIHRFHKATSSNKVYFSYLSLAFVGYEIARLLSQDFFNTEPGKIVEAISHYLIPYSLVFAIGLRLPSLQRDEVLWSAAICLLLFVSVALYLFIQTGGFVPTQTHKYPPTLYYFSYALGIALIAWVLSESVQRLLDKVTLLKAITLFIAQNSIWIYLWHIPFVKVATGPFPVKYLLVLSAACLMTWVQVWLVHNWGTKIFKDHSSQRNIKILLTG